MKKKIKFLFVLLFVFFYINQINSQNLNDWNNINDEQQRNVIIQKELKKSNPIIIAEHLGHKDLILDKSVLKTSDGKASVLLENIPKDVIKIIYDSEKKEFVYKYKLGSFKFDEGYIDKDGKHVPKASLDIKTEINVKGDLEYKNGKYSLGEGSWISFETKSGKVYHEKRTQNKEPGIVEINDKGEISSMNSKVSFVKKGSGKVSATIETSTNYPITIFADDKDHTHTKDVFKGPLASVDLEHMIIDMNGKDPQGGKDHYIKANIYENFKEVRSGGEQTWLVNGENGPVVGFYQGGVNTNRDMKGALYEVDFIIDLKTKSAFTWKKIGDNEYADFYFSTPWTVLNGGKSSGDTFKNADAANILSYKSSVKIPSGGGSGTIIGIDNNGYPIVLTAGHLGGATSSGYKEKVELLDGRQFTATVIAGVDNYRDGYDISLMKFNTKVEDIPYVPVAGEDHVVNPGDPALRVGCPGCRAFRYSNTRVGELDKIAETTKSIRTVDYIFSGESGGGLFHQGRIIGVVSTDESYTGTGTVREFLKKNGYSYLIKIIMIYLK